MYGGPEGQTAATKKTRQHCGCYCVLWFALQGHRTYMCSHLFTKDSHNPSPDMNSGKYPENWALTFFLEFDFHMWGSWDVFVFFQFCFRCIFEMSSTRPLAVSFQSNCCFLTLAHSGHFPWQEKFQWNVRSRVHCTSGSSFIYCINQKNFPYELFCSFHPFDQTRDSALSLKTNFQANGQYRFLFIRFK